MNLTKKLLAGSILAAISTSSFALDFYVCPPSASGDQSTCSSVFEAMTVNLDSVSLYKDLDSSNGISAGDSVIDYGSGFVTGFTPWSFSTRNTTTNNLGLTVNYGFDVQYDDLAQTVVLVDDSSGGGTVDGNGEIGEQVGVAAAFVSGTIDLFYSDGGTYTSPILVAQLDVIPGGSATVGNFVGQLEVNFDNVDAANQELVRDMFFFDRNGGESWYTLWETNQSLPAEQQTDILIRARFDTNIDDIEVLAVSDPLPTTQGGVDGSGFTGSDYDFMRTTNLDGSIQFNIPEPGTLALIGAGMLGAGFAARRRNAKP